MKKHITLFAIVMLSLVGFNSCGNENEELLDSQGAKAIALTNQIGDVQSTEGRNVLPNQYEVGVFIEENTTEAPSVIYDPNIKYVSDGKGGLTTKTVPMFPSNMLGVKISAYYPYTESIEDKISHIVGADQSVDADYFKSDLLFSPAKVYPKVKGEIGITLYHMLANITAQVVAGPGDYANAKVELIDVCKNINFDRKTGVTTTPTTIEKSNITLHKTNGAVVVPQEIASGSKLFKVTIEGKSYFSPALASSLKLEKGKNYRYNISVEGETVSVESEIVDWIGVGSTPTEGNAISEKPLIISHPSFTEVGSTIVLRGARLNMVETLKFGDINCVITSHKADEIVAQAPASVLVTTSDVLTASYSGGKSITIDPAFSIINSLFADGNMENVLAMTESNQDPVEKGKWHFKINAVNNNAIGVGSVQTEAGVGNFLRMDIEKKQGWYNPLIGQRTGGAERGFYKLTFKARATAKSGTPSVKIYLKTADAGNIFFFKKGADLAPPVAGAAAGGQDVNFSPEWKEYTLEFDLNYTVNTIYGYTAANVAKSTSKGLESFFIAFCPNTNNSVVDIDEVRLEEIK